VCDPCAWAVQGASESERIFCREQSFGGYKLEDVYVLYSNDHESIEDVDTDDMLDERNNRNSVFLGGHVEWAWMLKCGEMFTVDKPFRSWSEDERLEWIGHAHDQIAKGKRRG
jgi:hypothetical protein